MTGDAVRSSRPLLTLGRVDQVRVQVGYRARPDGPAYVQFLLDLPVPEVAAVREQDGFDDRRMLSALEPVLYAGSDVPRHYSLHQHRSHTSWGPSPATLELGLLVTAGPATAAVLDATHRSVAQAFHDLLALVGPPAPAPTSRDAAILRARRSAAAAYAVDPEALSPSTEEHHPAENSWAVALRSSTGAEYDVVVGLVDGYAGSVRVRHEARSEVFDSVGVE